MTLMAIMNRERCENGPRRAQRARAPQKQQQQVMGNAELHPGGSRGIFPAVDTAQNCRGILLCSLLSVALQGDGMGSDRESGRPGTIEVSTYSGRQMDDFPSCW